MLMRVLLVCFLSLGASWAGGGQSVPHGPDDETRERQQRAVWGGEDLHGGPNAMSWGYGVAAAHAVRDDAYEGHDMDDATFHELYGEASRNVDQLLQSPTAESWNAFPSTGLQHDSHGALGPALIDNTPPVDWVHDGQVYPRISDADPMKQWVDKGFVVRTFNRWSLNQAHFENFMTWSDTKDLMNKVMQALSGPHKIKRKTYRRLRMALKWYICDEYWVGSIDYCPALPCALTLLGRKRGEDMQVRWETW